MRDSFVFTTDHKQNALTTKSLKNAFGRWKLQLYDPAKGASFKVSIDKVRGNELRAYWVLIGIVTDWMNGEGNHFTKEEVSDWFKMKCGHSKHIIIGKEGNLVPRSIAIKSDCTWEEMSRLIDYILQFGAENNIVGCELKEKDKEELKESFNNKK